ncbi:ISSoc2, transposase [Kaumoebavirus]|uniref:transposase n=1 Tax=Kaumoebavirus TaxID=1859492 RepID=UPI0009C2BBD0|nr:transposase [Kaumoebavirus]ARA71928.1 ISSoc2, transposase [Kaumoebavirus]
MREELGNLIKGIPNSRVLYPFCGEGTVDLNCRIKSEPDWLGDTIIRCKKVVLHLEDHQRNIIEGWFEVYRQVYNFTLKCIKGKEKVSFYDLRKEVKGKFPKGLVNLVKKSKIPANTVDGAINDVVKARKIAISNILVGNIKHFRLRPKKISKKVNTIVLESNAFSDKCDSFCTRALGKKIRSTDIIQGIDKTCRLTWKKGYINPFILHVPEDRPKLIVKNKREMCSLDPGIRTFQTLYDTERYVEIGKRAAKKLEHHLDRIHKNKEHQKEKWYKKLSNRLYDKIKHTIDDLHYKTANFLCRSYKKIFIGDMSTKGIVRTGGNLNGSTKDLTHILSHYTFRMRLIEKAEQYNSEVIVVDEAYTSKTCGGCGKINENLGGAKRFNCSCGINCDRDLNGARNIMIKGLY